MIYSNIMAFQNIQKISKVFQKVFLERLSVILFVKINTEKTCVIHRYVT